MAVSELGRALDQEREHPIGLVHGPSGTIRGTRPNAFLTPREMGSCMKKAAEWLGGQV